MLFSEFARTPRPFWPPCWNFPLSFQNKYCLKTVFPCQNLPCHHNLLETARCWMHTVYRYVSKPANPTFFPEELPRENPRRLDRLSKPSSPSLLSVQPFSSTTKGATKSNPASDTEGARDTRDVGVVSRGCTGAGCRGGSERCTASVSVDRARWSFSPPLPPA